ncbi:MAG: patatin-like phospholipase family protein [Gammaproteobacteria bacterium]|nr:patatin-like phospholipase family protein [Gammaproteobacteria bacterium]
MRRPRIGIALGGGAARGWSHIGVLRWLQEHDFNPDIVCGTSIGALVGAAAAEDELDRLEDWVRGLTWQDVVSYLDVSFGGGFIHGRKLFHYLETRFPDRDISVLRRPYGAVATELASGQEVWFREGSLHKAVRASAALPGLFTPARHEDRWLVDGGLVNPVPVSLCRALGAERVIAVDLNADLLSRRTMSAGVETPEPPGTTPGGGADGPGRRQPVIDKLPWLMSLGEGLKTRATEWTNELLGSSEALPSLVDVIAQSVYIMQVRITRARMAGDPPDVVIAPRLSQIHLLEFHRAGEAIDAGYRCAQAAAETFEQELR